MSILHIYVTFHTFNGELGDELEDFGCKFVNILSKFAALPWVPESHLRKNLCIVFTWARWD